MRCQTVLETFQNCLLGTMNVDSILVAHLKNCEYCQKDCKDILDKQTKYIDENLRKPNYQKLKHILYPIVFNLKPYKLTLLENKPFLEKCFSELNQAGKDFAKNPKKFILSVTKELWEEEYSPYKKKGWNVSIAIWLCSFVSLYSGVSLVSRSFDSSHYKSKETNESTQYTVSYIKPAMKSFSIMLPKFVRESKSSVNHNVAVGERIATNKPVFKKSRGNYYVEKANFKPDIVSNKATKTFLSKKIAVRSKSQNTLKSNNNQSFNHNVFDNTETSVSNFARNPLVESVQTNTQLNLDYNFKKESKTSFFSNNEESKKVVISPFSVILRILNPTIQTGQITLLGVVVVGERNSINVKKARYTLRFNPRVVKIKNVQDGGLMSLRGEIATLQFSEENGILEVYIERSKEPTPDVNGQLALIYFEGVGEGVANLELTNFIYEDENGISHAPVSIVASGVEVIKGLEEEEEN